MLQVLRRLTGRDVSDDRQLGGELHVRPEECSEEFCEGAAPEPGVDGIEHELIASVRIPRFDVRTY